MGCCFSRPSDNSAPYPADAPNSSARAINTPAAATSLPEAARHDSNREWHPPHVSRRRSRRQSMPLDQKINKPLRRHQWTAKDRSWTTLELAREREAFFDTRVTGREEAWQTIHAALRVLWEAAEGSNSDNPEPLALAQSILSAGDLLLPTGDLSNGVYDSFGNYYPLPEYIVCDPSNVVDDPGDKGGASVRAGDSADDDGDDSNADAHRGEKGKQVVEVSEQVPLTARLSEDARDYRVTISMTESIHSVANKIAEQAGLSKDKKIRIAYMGKILKDSKSLDAQGWHKGHLVNALVFSQQ